MRLHNPISEINANPFPLFGGLCCDQALGIFAQNYRNFQVLSKEAKVTSLSLRQKSTGLVLCDYTVTTGCNHSLPNGGNGGTKVVDQLLIDISTGESSVEGSHSSARDNIQAIDSGKLLSRKKSTSETTAKTTTNRTSRRVEFPIHGGQQKNSRGGRE